MEHDSRELMLERDIRELEKDPEFIAEDLAIQVIEEMLKILQDRGLSRAWLAKQMGVSRSSVSRMMNAAPNMTLLTISRIALALGITPAVLLDSKSRQAGAVEREAVCVAEPAGGKYESQKRSVSTRGRKGGR
ncbi:MAG: helix-turn-helix transcriptional regulator [Chloroflexi bacterium]|nr:helix-turn-helix transcriptional regulator [Chloroflexota bacterium]